MSLQEKTIQTYQKGFADYKKGTPSEVSGEFVFWMDSFIKYLSPGAKVFEFGSANGRDARYMRERCLEVFCTDIMSDALQELESDNFQTAFYDFRDAPKVEWENSFDGVFAKAVFLHATQEVFENAINNFKFILKQGGIICLTFKQGVGEEVEIDRKMNGERYFKYYTRKDLEDIFAKHPELEILEFLETEDKKWIQVILKKVI